MNPLMRIAFVVIVSLPLLISLDVVSAGITLALEAVTSPIWLGSPRLRARRAAFAALTILVALVATGTATALYGRPGGAELFTWGPVRITELSLGLAVAACLRVAALVMPAVLIFATLDIAELGDALIQIARVPARFVWGAVAGLRLIELTTSDFGQVRFARRARGLRSGPVSALMPLMVVSLRRAESMAVAMEARGFDRGERTDAPKRTNYRASSISWRDACGLVVAVFIAAIAIIASLLTGAWHVVLT